MSEPFILGLTGLRLDDRRVIPRCIRETAKFDVIERECGDLMVTMSAWVLAERLAREARVVSFEVPASWWQHWKRDCAPAWLRRRWPVQTNVLTRTVEFEAYRTYPEASIPHAEILNGAIILETVHVRNG